MLSSIAHYTSYYKKYIIKYITKSLLQKFHTVINTEMYIFHTTTTIAFLSISAQTCKHICNISTILYDNFITEQNKSMSIFFKNRNKGLHLWKNWLRILPGPYVLYLCYSFIKHITVCDTLHINIQCLNKELFILFDF